MHEEYGISLFNGLSRNLRQFFKLIIGFQMTVIIVMIVFIVQGYCAFGSQVQEFFSVYDSVLSALRILINNFNVQSFEPTDQLFTLFFLVFTNAINFVLLFMLVMIVFHGYFFVDIQTNRDVYLSDNISMFMESKMGLNKSATWLQSNRLKRERQNDHIAYQELYQMLKRWNLTDFEVENTLNNYNIKPNETVHIDVARQMFENILQQIDDESESSNFDGQTTEINSNNTKWVEKRVQLIQNALKEVKSVCAIIKERLDVIRVPWPATKA